MTNLLVNESFTGESESKSKIYTSTANQNQIKQICNQRTINKELSNRIMTRGKIYEKTKNNRLQFSHSLLKAEKSTTVFRRKCPRKMSLINIPSTSSEHKTYSKYSTKSQRATTPQSIKSYSRIRENNINNSKKHFDSLFNEMIVRYGSKTRLAIDKKHNNKKINQQSSKTNMFYLNAFSRRTLKDI